MLHVAAPQGDYRGNNVIEQERPNYQIRRGLSARDALDVASAAIDREIREFVEAEKISIARPRPRCPWQTIRQALPQKPLRWLRNVAADIAKFDSDKMIGVTCNAGRLAKFRNQRVADQGEPA